MNNCSNHNGSLRSRSPVPRKWKVWLGVAIAALGLGLTQHASAAPAANLDQYRNGTADAPDTTGSNWVNGNVGEQNAHFIEGFSIPYRARMTDIPLGTPSVTLVLGFDVKHSDKDAIDYLTYYRRLEPHNVFIPLHPAEPVDPTAGTGFSGAPDSVFQIPAPTSLNTPVPGQPVTSYNSLVSTGGVASVSMVLWGGTITSIQYGPPADLSLAQSEQTCLVTFTPSGASAVLAWGGHIGSRLDWGFDGTTPRSAGGISGSPYHMRLKSWGTDSAGTTGLGNLGNQDRSLSAQAILAPPSCSVTGPNPVCAGSTVTYTVTTDGASPTFAWSFVSNTAGATFNGSTTSSSVQVVVPSGAANGSSFEVQVVVSISSGNSSASSTCSSGLVVVGKVSASAVATAVSCNGGSTGSVDLTVTGGTPGYTYAWSNGATTQDLSNVPAGTYSVTVTDSAGCTATASATVTQPDALVLSQTHVNVSCNGGSNGSIDLTVTGGTPAYTYAWSNGATTQDLSGLAAGTYTVTVTDSKGCTATTSATITQPDALVLSQTHVNVSCNGGSNGSIDLTVTGGTPSYTYAWSNGATTQDLSGLAAGTYTVTVTDSKGCTATTSATITQPDPLTANAGADQEFCGASSCGTSPTPATLSATASGGTGTKTFLWTWSGGSQAGATIQVSPSATTVYTVTVTDANGCTASDTATVTVLPQVAASTLTPLTVCSGAHDASFTANITAGNATAFSWSIQPSGGSESALVNGVGGATIVSTTGGAGVGTSSLTLDTAPSGGTPLAAGTYTIKVLVTGTCGCDTQTAELIINPCNTFCSLTQGFYGNLKGKFQGIPGEEFVQGLLDQGELKVGDGNNSIIIDSVDCLKQMLPGGGPSSVIVSGGPWTSLCDYPQINPKNGRIRNNALAQLITLGLNLRIESPTHTFLTQLDLTLDEICVSTDSGCSCLTVPDNIKSALEDYGDTTLAGFWVIANRVMGSASNAPSGVSAGDVGSLAGAINELFDECRQMGTCSPGTDSLK